jgi:N-acetyl-anhydromuramyl-L-alanine amidase AmpD
MFNTNVSSKKKHQPSNHFEWKHLKKSSHYHKMNDIINMATDTSNKFNIN